MEIKEMTFEQTEERLSQITEEMKNEGADLEEEKCSCSTDRKWPGTGYSSKDIRTGGENYGT